ncbi:MAG: response regulator, partial [Acidimicrobiia bacterium]
ELDPSSMLARTLEHLALAIPGTLDGDEGGLSVAIDTVRALIVSDELVAQLPDPMVADDQASDEEPAAEPVVSEEPVAEETPTEETSVEDEAIEEVSVDETPQVEEPDPTPDATPLDADDMADVAATLDKIEEEIAAASAATAETETAAAEAPVAELDDAEPEVAETPDPEPEAVEASDVEPEVEEPAAKTVEATEPSTEPSTETGDVQDDEPLVFEPGPDGRLPTPAITYEIVNTAFEGDSATAPTPASAQAADAEGADLSLVETGPSVLDPANNAVYDLGGLLGAVEMWASEESVPVNAGRLFRMINDVAALRIDLESATTQASTLLTSTDSGLPASAIEGAEEALETVRRASVNLQGAALGLTMTPLTGVTATLPQLAKYLSKKTGRDVQITVEGEETAVDRQLADRIGEIIRQLVVNAVAHGIEPASERLAAGKPAHGEVKLALTRNDNHLQITVEDDGGGVDWAKVRKVAADKGLVSEDPTAEELRSVLYSDGFSTDESASEFTGDGEGLARVTEIVGQVFGTMTLDSTKGRGTTFEVTMPAHRALQRAQIFTAGGRSWGIPDSSVVDFKSIPEVSISVTERGSFVSFGGESIPYASFSTVVGLDVEGLPSQVMIVQSPTGAIALAVDEVLETHEVATKDLSPLLSGSSSVVSGVALLGGDDTVMLVDAGRLSVAIHSTEVRPSGPVHTVLVVDDSQGVRQVVSGVLASHGFSTVAAGSVSDALAALAKHTVDALVVDFSMPRADGVALIHMVRQRYGDIPVVMLSGAASEEDRTRAERAGVHAFFDKADFAKGALVEKLRELIDGESADSSAEKAS